VVFEYFGGIGVRFTVGTAYQDGAELVFDHPVRRHHPVTEFGQDHLRAGQPEPQLIGQPPGRAGGDVIIR